MIYKIVGNFHFLGFEIPVSLDIEASSCQLAKDIYKNNFSNFTRLKDLQDYLKKTSRSDILYTIQPGSEYAAIICIEDIRLFENNKEQIIETIEESDEEIDTSSVTVRDGSSEVHGLKTALRNQQSGTYKIKIVDHEPIIIGRPVEDQNEEVIVEHPLRRYGYR
jgi:hypothetical protein